MVEGCDIGVCKANRGGPKLFADQAALRAKRQDFKAD